MRRLPLCRLRGASSAAGLLLALLAACDDTPSDDPADWEVEARAYTPRLGEPRWIAPSALVPPEVTPVLASNNNVGLVLHEGALYLAWRTAPTHFASSETRVHLVRSTDMGRSWSFEHTLHVGADMREPAFLSLGGRLFFHVFEAGTNPVAFEPRAQWRMERRGEREWTERAAWGQPAEITWDMKVRGGRAWRTSYLGTHYQLGVPSAVQVHFTVSDDGVSWKPVGASPVVYTGGVSEVAFELDADGSLWAVGRNEDGDSSGWGTQICTAPAKDLGRWTCLEKSDPERYDSPELLRHGADLYLIGRRDIGGPFDQGLRELSFADQQQKYLLDYWRRPKRTALYQIDKAARRVVHLFDFPSSGDTSFPSVVRTGAHTFLVANYTSPPEDSDRSWVEGQSAADGTAIYLVDLRFE